MEEKIEDQSASFQIDCAIHSAFLVIEKSLQNFKDGRLKFISNYNIQLSRKNESFIIMCSIISTESKSFLIQFEYVPNKPEGYFFYKKNSAPEVWLSMELGLFTERNFLRKKIRNFIKERRKGFGKEKKLVENYLPRLKAEKVIVGFKKTTTRDDVRGLDFTITVNDGGKEKRDISFDLKSSIFYQRRHSKKYPKKSSIAIVDETEYSVFKVMISILISQSFDGIVSRLRDKRCLY